MTASQRSAPVGPATSGITGTPGSVVSVALAVATVHLFALVVRPTPGLLAAIFEGAVVVGLVVVEFWLTRSLRQAVSLGAVAGTAVAGVWFAAWLAVPLWQVAVGGLGTAGILGYGLHRYQLVSLGHVEESDGN